MKRVVLLAFLAEELLVQDGVRDLLMDIHWHLEPVSDMLARREASEEAAVLGGGVPRVARVYDHAPDVARRLVDLVHPAVGEALVQPRVDGLLVGQQPVVDGGGLLALREQ